MNAETPSAEAAPRGARNKLASHVFEDVLEIWNEPAAEGLTRGKAAMLAMWRERPNEFVKSVFSVLPRELLFENITAELADDELDRMIEALRASLNQEQPVPLIEATSGQKPN